MSTQRKTEITFAVLAVGIVGLLALTSCKFYDPDPVYWPPDQPDKPPISDPEEDCTKKPCPL